MAEENPQNAQNQSHLQLLTVKQFCETYGVTRPRVYERIKAGLLQAVRKPGSSSGQSPYYIIDPGWRNVSLSTNAPRKDQELPVEDVYILTGKEVATLLGVNPRTVRKMAEDGRIGFMRTGFYGRSHRRYCLADVRKLIATTQKGSFQIRRPSRSAVRAAVLKWARERLGIQETVGSTLPANHPPCTNT